MNSLKIIFPIGMIFFFASCKTVTMKKADEAMQLKNYAISADMYDQLASNTKLPKDVRQTAAYRGAESYRYNHQPKKALKLYVKAKKYGAKDPAVLYQLHRCTSNSMNMKMPLKILNHTKKKCLQMNVLKP